MSNLNLFFARGVAYRPAPDVELIRAGAVVHTAHRGPQVRTIQRMLDIALLQWPGGWALQGDDGYFGDETDGAVRAFQRRVGITVDGKVGPVTYSRLVDGLRAAQLFNRVAVTGKLDDKIWKLTLKIVRENTPAVRMDPTKLAESTALLSAEVPRKAELKKPQPKVGASLDLSAPVGNSGPNRPEDVAKVQDALVRHGYLSAAAAVRGLFEESTRLAVLQFQLDHTRVKDGQVDPGFSTSRHLARLILPSSPRYLQLNGPVGLLLVDRPQDAESVKRVQGRLVHHGYLQAGRYQPGIADETTLHALLDFQFEQLGYRDGVARPGGPTARALSRNALQVPRGTTPPTATPEPDKNPVKNPSHAPPTTPPASVDQAGRKAWLKTALAKKTFMPGEPRTNAAQLPMPPWFKAQQFMSNHGLATKVAGGKTQYSALTGVLTRYKDGKLIPGGSLSRTKSTHFIVHETDGLTGVSRLRQRPRRSSVNLLIGRDDKSALQAGHWLANDFAKSKSGSKWQIRNRQRAADFGFVSVELVTPRLRRGAKQTYTEQQYHDLALAYVLASHRAGRLLTVVPHRELDRGIPNGHSDPRHFDWQRFYDKVNTMLGLPKGTLLGYPLARDKGTGSRNLAAHRNTFPNVYGRVKTR